METTNTSYSEQAQSCELAIFQNGNMFENSSRHNGRLFWFASDFVKMLGYKEYTPTIKPLQKAIQVCYSSNIDTTVNITEYYHTVDGKKIRDFKLSRFACYLVAMNADSKKPNVAKFQSYFAQFAVAIESIIRGSGDVERVPLRQEVTEHEKTLVGIAKMRGVKNYALFQNEGYRGLYNMNLKDIKARKGIDAKTPLFDYMGSEELGANIFRVTQTEAKIKRENIKGQAKLEQVAFDVGKVVRKAMQDAGSTMPENLPPCDNIKKVKSDLKKTAKAFDKHDKITR